MIAQNGRDGQFIEFNSIINRAEAILRPSLPINKKKVINLHHSLINIIDTQTRLVSLTNGKSSARAD